MTEFRIPLIGEQAPEFNSNSTKGMINFPTDYKGKWVVLFSHPADFTPVCTTEFVAFQERKKDFDERGVSLIGYSVDGIQSHIAWVNNIKEKFGVQIEFPIVSDISIAYKYGMLHPSADSNHTVRAVFVIDPNGKIAALMYYPLSNGRSMDEILRLVDSLQMTANNSRATPADWPKNNVFKDRVIVPPAANMEQMEKNLSQYECKDWYLCTQENPNK